LAFGARLSALGRISPAKTIKLIRADGVDVVSLRLFIQPATFYVNRAAAKRRPGIQKMRKNYWFPAFADILLGQFILHGSIFSAKSGRFSRFALHRISKQI